MCRSAITAHPTFIITIALSRQATKLNVDALGFQLLGLLGWLIATRKRCLLRKGVDYPDVGPKP